MTNSTSPMAVKRMVKTPQEPRLELSCGLRNSSFFRHWVFRHSSFLALALLCLGQLHSVSYGKERPNVILMMADDLGWGDPQCFDASSPIKTPHLDEMSWHALKFTRFYAASSVCSPTRGACLTGRHPYRYGIPGANKGHLRTDEICLAEVMREANYRTGHFGKWHLGTMSPNYSGKGSGRQPKKNYCTPGMSGFDEWFSTEFAVSTWDPYDVANSHLGKSKAFDTRALYWHNGRNVKEPLAGCDSRIIMDRAIPFIEDAAQDKEPFFVVIWFHAPHQPVVGGPEYRAMYAEHSEDQQHYYAVVTALDEQVGRLRSKLRALNVAENTMLWFCSDNGPEGNPRPKGRSQGSAGPFRGRKRSLYEGGVRVPGLLEWPARIEQARSTNVPCVTSDLFPTIIEAIGLEVPDPKRPYDGISLVPLIEGSMQKRPRPIGFQFGKQASFSGNRFKLIHNANEKRSRSDNGSVPTMKYELYDLINDPRETVNVAEKHPEVVVDMRRRLDRWMASCRASQQGRDYLQED